MARAQSAGCTRMTTAFSASPAQSSLMKPFCVALLESAQDRILCGPRRVSQASIADRGIAEIIMQVRLRRDLIDRSEVRLIWDYVTKSTRRDGVEMVVLYLSSRVRRRSVNPAREVFLRSDGINEMDLSAANSLLQRIVVIGFYRKHTMSSLSHRYSSEI